MCPSPGTLKSSAHAKEADWELGVIGEGMGTKGEVVIMAQGKAQLCPHGSDPRAKLEKAQSRHQRRSEGWSSSVQQQLQRQLQPACRRE